MRTPIPCSRRPLRDGFAGRHGQGQLALQSGGVLSGHADDTDRIAPLAGLDPGRGIGRLALEGPFVKDDEMSAFIAGAKLYSNYQ